MCHILQKKEKFKTEDWHLIYYHISSAGLEGSSLTFYFMLQAASTLKLE
jgi:hypothetical protein